MGPLSISCILKVLRKALLFLGIVMFLWLCGFLLNWKDIIK